MKQFDIKNRFTGAVIYSGGGESLRDVIVQAAAAGADLSGADLRCADLRSADLRSADLSCADLSCADLRCADLRSADLRSADLSCADLSSADLSCADLSCADLRCAYLRGAYLRSADLSGIKLIGDRPIMQIGPIGSRSDYLVAHLTDSGVMIRAGCFFGSLEKFRAACIETHGDNAHGREYAAVIAMIEAHAQIWTPAEEVAE